MWKLLQNSLWEYGEWSGEGSEGHTAFFGELWVRYIQILGLEI